jgi:NAD(P)-dependent dehydrogenase (short-subunit alcohol dehydrogenase family)
VNAFDLTAKTAMVTGAAGGIGQGLVTALADAGAHVVAAGRSADPRGEWSDDARVSIVQADVTRRDQLDEAVERIVDRRGRLDILVTCAGVQVRKPALDIAEAEWDDLMEVNLKGAFLACQAAGRVMKAQGDGRIINVTSLTAEIGLPYLAAYGASKGGVNQLTKALAVEWAPFGIRVNAVGPGRLRTAMTEPLFQDDAVRESFLRLVPLGRAGTVQDLAGAVVFLASDASAYITGQSLYVDGGWLAGGGNPAR